MTLGEMKAEFRALLNRRDLTATQEAAFFRHGTAWINRRLRTPANEKVVSAVITNGENYAVQPHGIGLVIPSDYLQLINLQAYDQSGNFHGKLIGNELELVKQAARGSTGVPTIFAREGVEWLLGPSPADGVKIRVNYYCNVGEFEDDNDDIALSRIAPDLFTYAALSYAGYHFVDDRTPAWNAMRDGVLADLQLQADRDETAGERVVRPAIFYPQDDD
jgi:hypothetical protein